MSLRELLAAPEGGKVSDIAWQEVQTVPLTADREDVARLVREYDLVAVPVVDRDGVIQGVVTVDDVIDALVEEHTEDVQRFGGMEALDMPYTQIGFFSMIGKRAPWLAALFLSEMLTTTAMGHFQGELEKAVVLALFVPLIISSGQLRLSGDVAHHPLAGAGRDQAARLVEDHAPRTALGPDARRHSRNDGNRAHSDLAESRHCTLSTPESARAHDRCSTRWRRHVRLTRRLNADVHS
jgi:hypothetical protein